MTGRYRGSTGGARLTARGNVGGDEAPEQGRFAHSGLANDGDVPQAVVGGDAETPAVPAVRGLAEDRQARLFRPVAAGLRGDKAG